METKTRTTTLAYACPLPLRRYARIVMGHGSGGQMTHELITHLFKPAFAPTDDAPLMDAAIMDLNGYAAADFKMVFSTDTFVVNPLFFPGGDIGSLAIHGTVNDLAMLGAQPLYLSAGFILEEGLAMETLTTVVHSMAAAASAAGVQVIAGDTKVVERGHGDGLFINTSGVGVAPTTIILAPSQVQPGDALIVSGNLGDHGIAIMSQRAGLQFESEIISDSTALHGLVQTMLERSDSVRMLRDLTRGGLSAALNEIAGDTRLGITLEESAIPVQTAVASACDMLGLDPLYVANEGKLLAIVRADDAESMLTVMRNHPLGKAAAIVGAVTEEHPGVVVGRTAIGGRRVVDLPAGELLPRIC